MACEGMLIARVNLTTGEGFVNTHPIIYETWFNMVTKRQDESHWPARFRVKIKKTKNGRRKKSEKHHDIIDLIIYDVLEYWAPDSQPKFAEKYPRLQKK